ncbi:MAG: hypothetical protein H6981_07460 [Gammaproteobacteria bacterium]|nr:hypothetical protein [Gammaproteobacteria bacterium]MCP5136620.1 hypothetical protein [Gammaproteobacteria bacterium]
MRTHFSHFLSPRPRRTLVLLVAIWLFGVQILLACHQAEHIDAHQDADCVICLVGHGLDHAGTVSATLSPVLATSFVAAVLLLAEIRPAPRIVYRSRAPPR